MNRMVDGTQYRDSAAGIVAVRGKRELHLLGNSVAEGERAKALLAAHSFDRLFRAARRAPHSRNVAYMRMAAA